MVMTSERWNYAAELNEHIEYVTDGNETLLDEIFRGLDSSVLIPLLESIANDYDFLDEME